MAAHDLPLVHDIDRMTGAELPGGSLQEHCLRELFSWRPHGQGQSHSWWLAHGHSFHAQLPPEELKKLLKSVEPDEPDPKSDEPEGHT
jgi:hypothetical protein